MTLTQKLLQLLQPTADQSCIALYLYKDGSGRISLSKTQHHVRWDRSTNTNISLHILEALHSLQDRLNVAHIRAGQDHARPVQE